MRDIIFEDFNPQPSQATVLLQAAGYAVFSIYPAWHKPKLLTLEQHGKRRLKQYEVVNLLATLDPKRARARFESAGWKCLRVQARLKK